MQYIKFRNSTIINYNCITCSSASSGHSSNQSIVQQFTRLGCIRKRVLKFLPIGLMHIIMWSFSRQRLTKYVNTVNMEISRFLSPPWAANRVISIISCCSSIVKRFGTSPSLSKLLISFKKVSSRISSSPKRNTRSLPIPPEFLYKRK